VEDFDPRQNFGEDTAAGYDDDVRGDEAETRSPAATSSP